MNLFAMSVSGGVLIIVTVLLRAVFAEKLPQKTFLALWAVALGRLLLPFHLPSPASVYNAPPLAKIYAPALGVPVGAAETAPSFPWLTALWAAGAAACALFFIVAWVRCRLEFRESLPVTDERPRRWLLGQGLRRQVRLCQSDRVSAPLTYGLLRPVILLPNTMDWDKAEQAQYVLTHELVHIRRLDGLWKMLLIAALCLHWFNPLVWVMVLLANRDLEISCDERVVRAFGSGARRGYALALLGMEERRGALRPLCNSFSKNAIEERIRAIMNGKKTTLMTIMSGLAVVTAVTLVFATSAQAAEAAPAPATSATGTAVVQDKGYISTKGNIAAVAEGSGWKDPDDIKPDPETGKYYTKAQYNKIAALRANGSEKQSIAQFNRELRAKFYGDEPDESLFEAFEYVRAELPADDPLAQWVYYTVPASLNEYETRVDEVYSGKRSDPSFSAEASRTDHADVYGDQVQIHYAAVSYSFTYRILQQDTLTVEARDAFLLAITKGMQEYLDKLDVQSLKDDTALEKAALEELGRLGKNSTTDAIEYTGGTIEWSQYEPAYEWGEIR